MSLVDLKKEIEDEVSTILSSSFTIEVTSTDSVPHSNDGAITYPNLDTKTQKTKLIDTCVLYIDVRRSTDLNLTHTPKTVAKLYSAFVRAMTKVARRYKGHVRGIIGDRVMVIFDRHNAFVQAVDCAIAMNTVCTHIINKHFKANQFTCGIGIDCGKMLATKTGVRRNGVENANYKNLVWLGRPANVASKLTDIAAKPAETVDIPEVLVAYPRERTGSGLLFSSAASDWRWDRQTPADFLSNLKVSHGPIRLTHSDPFFQNFVMSSTTVEVKPKTPEILMTEAVWNGYKAARPTDPTVTSGWFTKIGLRVPNYAGIVIGGNVVFTELRD